MLRRLAQGEIRLLQRLVSIRHGAAVVCLATILLGVSQPQLLACAGLDFWNLPQLNRDIEIAEQAGQKMEVKSAAVQQRIRIKDQIVAELINGQVDLLDAAARFRILNAADPRQLIQIRRRYPDLTKEECHFRSVIDYAECTLPRRADGDFVRLRLEREFQSIRAHRAPRRGSAQALFRATLIVNSSSY
jgi:hypothetical protein